MQATAVAKRLNLSNLVEGFVGSTPPVCETSHNILQLGRQGLGNG